MDLIFDPATSVIRATQIDYFKGAWSVSLNYLPYGPLEYIPDWENPNLDGAPRFALISGGYPDLDAIIEALEAFLERPMGSWWNFSRNGYHILLGEEELSMYRSIDWNNWLPIEIIVPKNSSFKIIKPADWRGTVRVREKP